MRKTYLALGAAALLLLGAVAGNQPSFVALAQNVACYMQQGGASWNAGSGCTWSVKSGGVLNIESGGVLKFGGTATNIARGEAALGGSNPTAVTTGLTTISSCTLTIKATAAPTTTTVVSYGSSGGTANLYGWKHHSPTDADLEASTGTDTVGWECLGT